MLWAFMSGGVVITRLIDVEFLNVKPGSLWCYRYAFKRVIVI
jgi:hypothetical protein